MPEVQQKPWSGMPLLTFVLLLLVVLLGTALVAGL